ncbi:MAG: tryptophan synthase subunit alpha [Halodesulfovibrio sp.]
MTTSRLTERIRKVNAAGRKALIPFIPGGFPDLGQFWTHLEALDAGGADIIEIGVPFSDPCADGPVVEKASIQALEAGVSLKWLLDGLKARAGRFQAELVLMGYLNPFLQYGFDRLAEDAAAAGVSGFIIPDLPLDEDAPYRAALKAKGMALVPLVGLNTDLERMKAYAAVAEGYVYVVSVLGTTGARESFPAELADALARAREAFSLPIALGFGIKEPGQLKVFGDSIDAVIFGSALITHIRETGSVDAFMARWA